MIESDLKVIKIINPIVNRELTEFKASKKVWKLYFGNCKKVLKSN